MQHAEYVGRLFRGLVIGETVDRQAELLDHLVDRCRGSRVEGTRGLHVEVGARCKRRRR